MLDILSLIQIQVWEEKLFLPQHFPSFLKSSDHPQCLWSPTDSTTHTALKYQCFKNKWCFKCLKIDPPLLMMIIKTLLTETSFLPVVTFRSYCWAHLSVSPPPPAAPSISPSPIASPAGHTHTSITSMFKCRENKERTHFHLVIWLWTIRQALLQLLVILLIEHSCVSINEAAISRESCRTSSVSFQWQRVLQHLSTSSTARIFDTVLVYAPLFETMKTKNSLLHKCLFPNWQTNIKSLLNRPSPHLSLVKDHWTLMSSVKAASS